MEKNCYSLLLNFVCEFDQIEGGKHLYSALGSFLEENLHTSPLIAISLGKRTLDQKKYGGFKKCRILWNKEKLATDYDEDVINSLLEETFSKDQFKGTYHSKQNGDEFYYVLDCGESDSQYFFVLFKSAQQIENETLDYIVKFLLSNSRRLRKVEDIKRLESLVHVDDVTGLYNQRKLLKDLDASIERYNNLNEKFSVLFLDIDHFKSVNDGHGHLVGTKLLSDMAVLLKQILRESDLIYRYGGDEFVVIIRDIEPEMAETIAKRLLKTVKDTKFEYSPNDMNQGAGEKVFRLSVSIGVSGFPEDADTREEVLLMADRMMYQAKETGRGRVCRTKEIFQESEKKKA